VLALSLRTTSPALLEEILDAWFGSAASTEGDDVANVRHLDEIT
jgi:ribose 5-phosphate isomerase B